jgi:hypothetical protein
MRAAPFSPCVADWFRETFASPTAIQTEGWNHIAAGHDTLIAAPTGSGKTLAAFLWALNDLVERSLSNQLEDRVHVVYVSPLKALGNDIQRNLQVPLAGIRSAAAASGLTPPEIRVAVRSGDTPARERALQLKRPPHILITTPESLYILLTSQGFRPALAQTRFVIVDEVHAMLAGKRGAHLALSLERLQALVEAHTPGARPQRIGCSATVRPVEDAVAFLTGATAREPIVIDAGFSRDLDVQVVAPVDDFLTATSDTVWDATLQQIAELVQAHRTTLVFAQSRRAAERLARDLNDRIPDGRVAAHHGSLSRRARLEAEDRLGPLPDHRGERVVDRLRGIRCRDLEELQFHTERGGTRFNVANNLLTQWMVGRYERRGARHYWQRLLQELEPLGVQLDAEIRDARHAPARVRQTLDETCADGVRYPGEDDRYAANRRPELHPAGGFWRHRSIREGSGAACDDDVRVQLHDLGGRGRPLL